MLEAKKGAIVEERMFLFFFRLFAWLSSEKVHVLKIFSSDKQAYLSLVVGVCLP